MGTYCYRLGSLQLTLAADGTGQRESPPVYDQCAMYSVYKVHFPDVQSCFVRVR